MGDGGKKNSRRNSILQPQVQAGGMGDGMMIPELSPGPTGLGTLLVLPEGILGPPG